MNSEMSVPISSGDVSSGDVVVTTVSVSSGDSVEVAMDNQGRCILVRVRDA
jgi:hypothetical protein